MIAAAHNPRLARIVLVTGGCGFLGCNIADALAAQGRNVIVLDNMSRAGASENAEWLMRRHADSVSITSGDVRDRPLVTRLVSECEGVLHLAAQVAVTTSLQDPISDFSINAEGTLNILEAVRLHNSSAPVLFASTNKVYGKLLDEGQVRLEDQRYVPVDSGFRQGVSESAPLDLYSPYGCSKGGADQYVHDYARIFGLRTVVLRMSCIYGPRQFGTEDQGWIAHFLLRAIRGEAITIYGDGHQVRDALYVDDAVAAWLSALDAADRISGCVFNLGGGTENSVSLLELVRMIAELRGTNPELRFAAWRPGDQPWYVSNISAIARTLGWLPRVSLTKGLSALDAWLDNRFASTPMRVELAEARA